MGNDVQTAKSVNILKNKAVNNVSLAFKDSCMDCLDRITGNLPTLKMLTV